MNAADLIREFEGLRLKAYPDPGTGGEPWTIGYGHTGGVKKGDTCTIEQANAWLAEDMAEAYAVIDKAVTVPLTRQQRDALCSFVFNVGGGAFQKSTLLRLLNDGDYNGASDQLLRWNKAGGRVIRGLTLRRRKERALFLSGTNIPQPAFPEEPMAPFLAVALPALVNALPEFAKIFNKPDVSERNVEAAVKASEIVMQAVGATNVQEAVEKVQTDPEAAVMANNAIRVNRVEIIDLIERINSLDQANIKSAREYNTGEPLFVNTRWLKMKFVHILSLGLVIFTGSFAWSKFGLMTPEIQSMVITAIIIGGFTAVIAYWLGSSSGSDKKTDDIINRLEK